MQRGIWVKYHIKPSCKYGSERGWRNQRAANPSWMNEMTVKDNEARISRVERDIQALRCIVVGNGERGMDEILRDTEREITAINKRMDVLETAQGVTNSEIRHFRNIYFQREGLDAMGNPIKRSWLSTTWEDKIAPNLLNNAVTAAIIIVILGWRDFIELITSLAR